MEKNQQLIFKNLGYSANGQSPKIKPILHILVLKLTKVGVLVTLLNMTTSMYLSSDMLILTDQYEKTQNAESLNSQCTFNLTSNESTFCTSPDLSIGKNNSAASHYLSPNLSVYGYSPNLNQSNIYEQSLFFMPSPQPSNSSSPLLMDPLSQFVSPICSQPYYQDSPVSFGSFENQPIEPMQSFNFQYDSIDEILHDISPCVDEDIFQLGLGQISQSPTTNLPTANSFKCDIPGCSKEYTRKYSLNVHMKTAHQAQDNTRENNEKQFVCREPGCDKAYFQKYTLKLHIKTVHQNIKPFKCEAGSCHLRFARRHDLERHLKTHSGVRDFYCPHCSKSFGRKEHLKTHEKSKSCRDKIVI